jgi:hypothetical protein
MMPLVPILLASVADPGDPIPFSRGLGGLMFVIGGLAGLRKARKLRLGSGAREDTPAFTTAQDVTTAQARAGLVRVRGTVVCDRPLLSPLTQTPCCFYRVEVEDRCDDSSAQAVGWRPRHRESSTTSFKLRDAAGVIEIVPSGLAVDAPPTFEHEVHSAAGNPEEERLLAYVRQNCPDQASRVLFSVLKQVVLAPEDQANTQERLQVLEERHRRGLDRETTAHSFLFRETCFLPGSELEIAGTACKNDLRRIMTKGPGTTPFRASTHFGQALPLASAHSGQTLPEKQNHQARAFAIVSTLVLLAGVLMMISPYLLHWLTSTIE